ncbi:MAG TPA: DUF4124 domain-containing protein [Thiothrix sp.]|nr:DUF4124 domain-containing protein [Thiothrix sp.]
MNKYIYSAAFVLLNTFSHTTFAKTDTGVYKWVDANKKVHYTDRPAPGKIIEKDIEEKIRKAAGLAAKKTAEKEHRYIPKTGSPERDRTKKNKQPPTNTTSDPTTELTKTEQTQKQTSEVYTKKLAAYCDQQTNNLTALQQDTPIAWEEGGKTALLSAEQRKEKIKEIQIVIKNKCAT